MNSAQENQTLTPEQQLMTVVQHARDLVEKGQNHMASACTMVKPSQGLEIDCHSLWSPLVWASLAAEGITTLQLIGLEQCEQCPKPCSKGDIEHLENDFQSLSQAMPNQLRIEKLSEKTQESSEAESEEKKTSAQEEPARRAFFRNVIPSLAKHATDTLQQGITGQGSGVQQQVDADKRVLPVENKLFLHALEKLQINHTPVPCMESIPLGNIQAEQTCTACGDCVNICPSHALSLRSFGRNQILEFQANACTACEQCLSACPEQAIQALPSISLPALLLDKPRPLVMVYANKD